MPRPTRSVSGAVADDKEFGPEVSSRGGGDGEPKSGRIVDAQELLDAMTCPVSGLVFVDPVTTTCGHTFSRQSLARWMTSTGSNQRNGAGPSCPTCRAPLYHESPHQWPVNTVLVDLAERFLRDEMIEARTLTYKMPGAIAGGSGVDGDSQAGQILGELPLFVLDSMTPGQELTRVGGGDPGYEPSPQPAEEPAQARWCPEIPRRTFPWPEKLRGVRRGHPVLRSSRLAGRAKARGRSRNEASAAAGVASGAARRAHGSPRV